MTPLKSIRAKCLDCCGYQANEVRLCHCETCPLWKFRFGRNPSRHGVGNHSANISAKNVNSQANLEEVEVFKGKDTVMDSDGERWNS